MKNMPVFAGSISALAVLCFAIANNAFARSHIGRGTMISGELFGRVGLCWTDPSSSSASSTSSSTDVTTTNYGIVFTLEPGNGNEIAADIYSLDSFRKKIKQVGHADVTATQLNGVFTFAGASDTPGQFSLSLTPQDYSSGEPREHGLMTAQLANAALFTGEIASNIGLRCDVADLNRLPAPSPNASVSPSSTPTVAPSVTPTSAPSDSPSPNPINSTTTSFD